NRLHLVWFDGDRASIDRLPTGIRYSTALTSAPRVIRPLVAAPPTRRATAPPTPAPTPSQVAAPTRQARSWADSAEVDSSWLGRAMERPTFPILAAMAAVAGLLAVVV